MRHSLNWSHTIMLLKPPGNDANGNRGFARCYIKILFPNNQQNRKLLEHHYCQVYAKRSNVLSFNMCRISKIEQFSYILGLKKICNKTIPKITITTISMGSGPWNLYSLSHLFRIFNREGEKQTVWMLQTKSQRH